MEGSVNMKMEVCCLPGVSEPMAIFKPFSFQYVYSGAHCENHSPSLLPTKTSWSSSFTDASTGSSKSSCFLFIKAAAPPDSINLQHDLVSRAWFSLAVLTNSLLQTNSVSSCGAERRIEALSKQTSVVQHHLGGILFVQPGLQCLPQGSSGVPGGCLLWEEATQCAVRTEQVILTTNAMPDVNGTMLGQRDWPQPSGKWQADIFH